MLNGIISITEQELESFSCVKKIISFKLQYVKPVNCKNTNEIWIV